MTKYRLTDLNLLPISGALIDLPLDLFLDFFFEIELVVQLAAGVRCVHHLFILIK